MAAENLETNTNPSPEEEKPPVTSGKRPRRSSTPAKETVALSVKGKSDVESHLVYHPQTSPGNRPIEVSHLKVVSEYSSVGGTRPIVASGMEIKGTLTISGHRPIAASHLQVSETYTVMGNRPVASNEIDDLAALMGFLD
jgi:hypothetical protein